MTDWPHGDAPDNRSIARLTAAELSDAVRSIDAHRYQARADQWTTVYAGLRDAYDGLVSELRQVEAAWEGPAGSAHHAQTRAHVEQLAPQMDAAHQWALGLSNIRTEVQRAQRDLTDLADHSVVLETRRNEAAAIAMKVAEAAVDIGATVLTPAAWSAVEQDVRGSRRAAARQAASSRPRSRRPGSVPAQPSPPAHESLLGARATDPQAGTAGRGSAATSLIGRNARPAAPPSVAPSVAAASGHPAPQPIALTGRRAVTHTSATGGTAVAGPRFALLGVRSTHSSSAASPDLVEEVDTVPAREAAVTAVSGRGDIADAIVDLVRAGPLGLGEECEGTAGGPVLIALEGTDEANLSGAVKLVAVAFARETPGPRSGTPQPVGTDLFSARPLVVSVSPALLPAEQVWAALADALATAVNGALRSAAPAAARSWLRRHVDEPVRKVLDDRVGDDRATMRLLRAVVVAGGEVVLLVHDLHRAAPDTAHRVREILRYLRTELAPGVRMVVGLDADVMATAMGRPDGNEAATDAGWVEVRRFADVTLPLSETVVASSVAREAFPVATVEADPDLLAFARERLGRLDLSQFRNAQLVRTWRLLLRLLRGSPRRHDAVAAARASFLLAELVTRWPELRSSLVRRVDGTHGLRLLAAAAGDDRSWDAAIVSLALDGKRFRGIRADLRHLLGTADAVGIADVAPWPG